MDNLNYKDDLISSIFETNGLEEDSFSSWLCLKEIRNYINNKIDSLLNSENIDINPQTH